MQTLLIIALILCIIFALIISTLYKKLTKLQDNSVENEQLKRVVQQLESALKFNPDDYISKDIHNSLISRFDDAIKQQSTQYKELFLKSEQLSLDNSQLEEELKKVKGAKKSGEVRLGLMAEKFVPFLENFPGDVDNTVPLLKPIDYISFGQDVITFIEVKSGGAKLSEKQKRIQELINGKKVEFKVYRLD